MRRSQPASTPVPFDPYAARAHRTALGLTPEQVAEGMAAHGVRLLPGHVLGWESGAIRPSEQEFIALARALWCPPVQLMGARPSCLRDHRVARELTREQAARRIGVTPQAYERVESAGRWSGDEEQTRSLARELGLGLRALVRVTGRQEELDRRLRQLVDGRWQAQLSPIARLVPVGREALAETLAELQADYHVPTHWGPSAAPDVRPTEPAAERFWTLLARHPLELPL